MLIMVLSCVFFLLSGSSFIYLVKCETREICNTEIFEARCQDNSVVVMESASYGRMNLGLCMKENFGHLGCRNDILHLADKWCSGLQSCSIMVPNQELNFANTECAKELALYMEVDYNCVSVLTPRDFPCTTQRHATLHGAEGYVASQVTTETGCGSLTSPWILEVSPGQILDIWLLDFGSRHSVLGVSCNQVLGYISEKHLSTNTTICRNSKRRKQVYSSKMNQLELQLVPRKDDERFLIQYFVRGCPDLSPPSHAWYRRDGNEAVIGCKSNDRVWRLYCNGNTWNGVVGNCSTLTDEPENSERDINLPFTSVIFLTCVVCGAVLLVIIVIMAGAVYVKKQSIKHGIQMRSDYASMTYFTMKPDLYNATLVRPPLGQVDDNQPLVEIGEKMQPSDEITRNPKIIQESSHPVPQSQPNKLSR